MHDKTEQVMAIIQDHVNNSAIPYILRQLSNEGIVTDVKTFDLGEEGPARIINVDGVDEQIYISPIGVHIQN